MLTKALGFLIVAIVAAIFAFGGFAADVTSAAKVLFAVFVIGFIVTLIAHFTRNVGDTPVK
jgi:uncharacterized membrane protein YtjA (UPF0391 family)